MRDFFRPFPILIGLAFFAAALSGSLFTSRGESLPVFWPADGFLLAILLTCGRRRRIPVLVLSGLACAAANLAIGKPFAVAFGTSAANLIEALVAEIMLRRFAGGPDFLDDLRGTFLFFFAATLAGAGIGGLIGGGTLAIFSGQEFAASFRSWWRVDAAGLAVTAPAIIAWRGKALGIGPGLPRRLEFAACLLAAAFLAYVIFAEPEPLSKFFGRPLPYVVFPLLLWGALRFGVRGASASLALVYICAAWFISRGHRPFVILDVTTGDPLASMHIFSYAAAFCSVLPAVLFDSRQRAVMGLRRWETRYQHLWKNRLVGVYISDIDGNVSDANDSFLSMVGYSRAELDAGALRLRDIATPEYIAESEARVNRFKKEGFLQPFEREWKLRGGKRLLTMMFASQLEDSRAILCMVMDVTELKRTQQELKHKENLYQSLVESDIIGVSILGEDKVFLEANDTYLEITGYDRDDLRSGRLTAGALHVPGPTAERIYDKAQENLSLVGRTDPGESLYLRKDGGVVPVFRGITRLEGTDRYLVVAMDMTELKRIQSEYEAAKHAAESANHAKSKFLAHMSHEIRTPLNGMLGMSSLLLESNLNEEQMKFARAAQRCGEHLLSLVNQVLDLSKIESEKLEIEQVPFRLSAVVENSLSPVLEKASRKGVKIVVKSGTDMPAQYIGDAIRLQQVLVNLLDNAVKFSEPGEITLSIAAIGFRQGKTQLEFKVLDSGKGMSKDVVERLFRPFQQGDSSMARKAGGTGLGLAISKGLVELMGGEIAAESTPGSGSIFRFTACFDPYSGFVEENPAKVFVPGSLGWKQSMSSAGILVVDDNPINLEVTATMLEKLGCRVASVDNGEAAIALLARQAFDLVLLDLEMPDMDGFEALRRIRSSASGRKTIPVVAVTANAVAGVREKCLAAGMDGYLAKPFSFHSLHQAIRPWFSSGANAPANGEKGGSRHQAEAALARLPTPSMDWKRLESFVGVSPSGLGSLHRLLKVFFETTHAELTSLRGLAASGDVQGRRKLLHKLRGGCATVGAARMSEIAADWERRIETGEGSDPSPDPVEALWNEFERVSALMRERYLQSD